MTDPYLRRHYAAAIGGCLVLAIAFCYALLHYWHFFHMGSPGIGLGIVFIVLPGSFALAVIAAILLMLSWEGDGIAPRRAVVRSLGAVAVMFAVFYTIEICRTAQYRGAEAAEGTLADYASSIFGIR